MRSSLAFPKRSAPLKKLCAKHDHDLKIFQSWNPQPQNSLLQILVDLDFSQKKVPIPSSTQTWLGNPRTKWRFIAGKIIELNGGCSSTPPFDDWRVLLLLMGRLMAINGVFPWHYNCENSPATHGTHSFLIMLERKYIYISHQLST